MEHIPIISKTVRVPVDISIHPYLFDHRFEGKAVFPAVESMQVLAKSIKGLAPDMDVACMTHAQFEKFLYIQPGTDRVAAFSDMVIHDNGDITARLLTKQEHGKSSITRMKEHATLHFARTTQDLPELPLDLVAALEGTCTEIPSERIYRDLVPFGAAYHNIHHSLLISSEGTIARTRAPFISGDAMGPGPLGSPFPLDAAFHAACAWGQRYARIVAFPVEIERRVIYKRTEPGETYISRIIPVKMSPDLLVLDIWIYDGSGNLFEGACGVRMRDVSAGRMKPPQWIIYHGEQDPREQLQKYCRAVSLIEMKTLLPFAEKTLSEREQKRYRKMADKRRRSYLAARLACKHLSRTLSGNDMHTAAHEIVTVSADLMRPCCTQTDDASAVSCSASHDDRFAVAVASDSAVGVDVEKISTRLLKSQRLYMSEKEQALVQESSLGAMEAAVRIWSIKEAVAKALGITLAHSWNRVEVKAIDRHESRFHIGEKDFCAAVHGVVGQHVFTLVCVTKPECPTRKSGLTLKGGPSL